MLSLVSEWRFEKGDRKSYIGSLELEYKSKSSWSKDWQKPGDSLCRVCRKVDESIDHIVDNKYNKYVSNYLYFFSTR